MTTGISQLLEKWSKIALEQGWVDKWVEGAIYPREMVFFIAACEANGVVNIIESGRQDGYSTEIMGFYAQQRNGRTYSIDTENDPERADRCRRRLGGNPNLVMIKGNSIGLIGPLLLSDRTTPTALLIDGPKGYLAMSLLLAASGFRMVNLVAMHNLHLDLKELELREIVKQREMFVKLAPGPHFYEDIDMKIGENWVALEEAEKTHCTKLQAARSLEQSSLGIIQLVNANRRKLLMKMSMKFGTRQPLRFFIQWWLLTTGTRL